MHILHINVRLTEGGAARIALDLHGRALTAGVESSIIYGYGAGARKSPLESQIPRAAQLATRPRVAVNYALHRLAGIEIAPPTMERAEFLRQSIRRADVVHLHAIHSYFLPFGWLSELLPEAKRIVWTCHDFWPITGRCAFLEGCDGWRRGCGVCPTGKNYPPSLLDFSATTFKSRRKAVGRHIDRIVFAAPSDFVRNQFMEALPEARVTTIRNGIDARLAQAASQIDWSAPHHASSGNHKVAVMANDLRDPTKVDPRLVSKIASMTGIELHTIGRNSPFRGQNIINHGEIGARERLVQLMRDMDVLVFTSQKDTFGLVMAEAMVCGVPVLALHSDAACEVLSLAGARVMSSPDQVLDLIRSRSWWDAYPGHASESLHQRALNVFSGDAMFQSYLAVYRESFST